MIRRGEVFAAILAVTLASILVAALFVPSSSSPSLSTTTTTTTSTSSTTMTTTVSITSFTIFSYTPLEPLQVQSVAATTSRDNATGNEYLTFHVAFKNVGNSPVYISGGCGSSLSATVESSSVTTESSGLRCLCAEFISPLNPGDSGTALTPGCWSGQRFRVTSPGIASVKLTLSFWSDQMYQRLQNTTILASIFVS